MQTVLPLGSSLNLGPFNAVFTDATPPPILESERLTLTPVTPQQAATLLAYYQDNRDHLTPWEPLRAAHFYTLAAQQERLDDMTRKMAADEAIHLSLLCRKSGRMVGECHFTHIMRGPFQACHLGFSLARTSQGQGLMTEALTTAINCVFSHYGLHRIMANYRPENQRSARLLGRLGFETEGRARAYLNINGQWADHILTALINDTL